jgi:HEAT repeat protein
VKRLLLLIPLLLAGACGQDDPDAPAAPPEAAPALPPKEPPPNLGEIRKELSQEFQEAVPGIAERLAAGDDAVWMQVFLDQLGTKMRATEEDAGFLAWRAFRGAKTPEQKVNLLAVVELRELHGLLSYVVRLLKDDDLGVAMNAAATLGLLDAKKTVPLILRLLNDRKHTTRAAAITALEYLEAGDAAPHIVPLLKDEHPVVRINACLSLRRLGHAKAIPQILPLLKDGKASVRSTAVTALAGFGDPDVISDLLPLLKDADAEVRMAALNALAELRAEDAVPSFIRLLKDPDSRIRRTTLTVLCDLGAREAADHVIPLLKSDDPDTRKLALMALRRWDATTAVRHILPLLNDDRQVIRLTAASTLCRMGSIKGVDTLLWEAAAVGSGEPGWLNWLNALRRRYTWNRLENTKVGDWIPARFEDLRARCGVDLGLAVELPESMKEQSVAGDLARMPGENRILLDVLWWALGDTGHVFVLERDRIRILPYREALSFWRTWWTGDRRDEED